MPEAIHPGVRIGHVHLKVADLDRALAFYCGVLGFELTQRYGAGAAFISAGGYHHHIGLNTWESAGGKPPPPRTTGLFHLAILYPTRAELADALRRLQRAGIALDGASDHGVSEALYLRDPDENGVELSWDRSREKWPRTADGVVEMFTRPLGLLVRGEKLDPSLSDKLMALVKAGELPFHAVTTGKLQPPKPGDLDPPRAGRFSSPDALLTPSYMAEAALDPGIKIEPAWKVSVVYGMPCAIYHQLPAAYYLAARFHDDFESAVLHALNGGGQNQARCILTGALVGAQVGLNGIPRRFLDGLENSAEPTALAGRLGEQAQMQPEER